MIGDILTNIFLVVSIVAVVVMCAAIITLIIMIWRDIIL